MLSVAKQIARKAQLNGWKVFAVGGFVRDMLLGLKSKDLDLEVFGPNSVDELVEFLQQFGKVDAVGKSFGVLKLRVDGIDLDVSLPRTESKKGQGHKGFVVRSDSTLTPFQAAQRRDFTFNALMLRLPECELVDFFNGESDLLNKRLHHTSERFVDDPLRVLRGMQFCGRFDLVAEKSTVLLSQCLVNEFDALAKERLWIEFEKWATKSVKPSRGLVFLLRSGWIKMFPELNDIVGVPQSPICHNEGSVWQHTKMVCDVAVKIAKRENLNKEDTLILVLAALCHDFGKAVSTTNEDGKISAIGHEDTGEVLAQSFLESIDAPKDVVKKVCSMVKNHMNKPTTPRGVRRLANKLEVSIRLLTLLMESDTTGRKSLLDKRFDKIIKLRELAESVKVIDAKPQPILMGRHLIEAGLKPGRGFGVILKEAFELQLNGEIVDLEGAKQWLASHTN